MIPEWTARYVGLDYETFDCWQLVKHIYAQEYGIDIGDIGDQRQKMRDRDWNEIPAPREGDVILFKTDAVKRHVGIVLDSDLMLHNERGSNSCIESYTSNLWRHRLVSIYRHVSRN
jgi:cell wall-associated NlpC family hydrolase